MNLKELREKDTPHLLHELTDHQRRLYELRTQAVTEKLEDPSQIVKTRKDIARLKTLLRQRDLVKPAATAATAAPSETTASKS